MPREEKSWEPVTIEDVKGLRATQGGALIVLIEGKTVAIPQALIDDDSEVWRPGDEGTLVIPEFLAIEKDLV